MVLYPENKIIMQSSDSSQRSQHLPHNAWEKHKSTSLSGYE